MEKMLELTTPLDEEAISQLKVGDVVKVWVVSVDEKKQRIALTMVNGKV